MRKKKTDARVDPYFAKFTWVRSVAQFRGSTLAIVTVKTSVYSETTNENFPFNGSWLKKRTAKKPPN